MNNKQKDRKKALRKKYLDKRNQMEPDKRRVASAKIAEWVFRNKRFKTAGTIFVYASYKSEVETKEIIQGALSMGKRVAVPKVMGTEMDFYEIHSWEELFPGYYGIMEPQVDGEDSIIPVDGDVMLLPGAVFDRRGGRIGYGGGYYDRYLRRIESAYGNKPYLMALAFSGQICPGMLPMEEHDKKMDCILTDRRVIMPKVEKGGKLDIVAEVVEIAIEAAIELAVELID